MPKILTILVTLLCATCVPLRSLAQDSATISKTLSFPDKWTAAIDKKTKAIEEKMDGKTTHYLAKFQKQEQRLKKKLWKKDSTLAKQLFEGVEDQYSQLKKAPENLNKYASVYSGHLDSLATSLKFLKENQLGNPGALQKQLESYTALQSKLNQADQIKKFVKERSKLLKEQFEKLGMVRALKSFQKQAYYYSAQINEYKQVFEDPSKWEAKLMETVMKLPQFKDFFAKNSQLGSLFLLPGSTSASSVSLAGLQTRASVNQSLVDRFGSGPNTTQMLRQNMQAAQGELSQLKNKLTGYGSGSYGNSSSEVELPEGFKPNSQKIKSFWGRLEYSANVQTARGSSYFPVTSDLGLSLGYKLNDKSAVGVGASYKLGWGSSWNNIKITHQGIGLRSYLDLKLKGSLYISGGYEKNCRNEIHTLQQLKDQSAWQSSGLVGLSKKYKLKGKMKGEMKLLWDFLSYQQVPRSQPIVFRIGYSLK